MSGLFTRHTPDDLAELVAEMPLCWIVPRVHPDAAILRPVALERGGSGRPRSLLGHLPRRAEAASALRRNPAASFLFLGPNGYAAPAQAGRSDGAPTWNFAAARITGQVERDEALTGPALAALVGQMERPNGWTTREVGERYDRLAARIIGFRAAILSVAPRIKLAQDETPTVRASITAALSGTALGRRIRRFDEDRR